MKKPIIKIIDEIDIISSLKNYNFNNVKITNQEGNVTCKEVLFDSCEIEKVDFTKHKIKKIEFIDCKLINCDLSNLEFEQISITRCEFFNCKMMGTNFIESSLFDCLFDNCICRYTNFSNVKIKNCLFKNTSFIEANFLEVITNNLNIDTCDFTSSQFYNNDFKGVDFSTSSLFNITTDLKSIKKVIVNSNQAIDLAVLLDIIVKL